MKTKSPVIFGFSAKLIQLGIKLTILKLALKHYKNPLVALNVLSQLMNKKQKIHGNSHKPRYIKSDSQYFWSTDFPGWPSETFNFYIVNEFIRFNSTDLRIKPLQTIIFAITNRCTYNCKHCFEWDKLDSQDKLSLNELKFILNKINELGIRHIQLSGGEPLIRFENMLELIKTGTKGTDFWILTSGCGLDNEKAQLLKKAGLKGVNISLDHWDEELHNNFRNNKKAFYWVKEAMDNCKSYGIIVSLSICVTKEFLSEENLWKYINLAKEWNVEFIRILEPRKAGRYSNINAELDDTELKILETFYLNLTNNIKFREYPILIYPGYHQRKLGCFGAGNRYLYIDSNADIHACPFCLQKHGNALNSSLEESIIKMDQTKCHAFKMNCAD